MTLHIRRALRNILGRNRVDQDLHDELDAALALMTEENIRRGFSPEEAVRSARLELGGVEQLKEEVREARAGAWVGTLLRDTSFGLRMLRKNPAFTAVVVLTLALGIGVNVAIFSIFDSFLFQLLPVKNPAQLATLSSVAKGGGESLAFSYPDFEDIQRQTTSIFDHVFAITEQQSDGISIKGKNEPILTSYVDGNYFGTLGVQPALGRLILPPEGKVVGADPVLVLGYSYWQTAFGGDPTVLGQRVEIDGHQVTIVGVAQKGFHGIRSFFDVQGYLPLGMAAIDSPSEKLLGDRGLQRFELIARLKTGVSLGQAQGALNLVSTRLSQQYPATDQWQSLRLREMGPLGPINGVNPIPIVAALFLILAGLILLLACLNIANLFLARAMTRRREMALRAALGASKGRLIRQSLTETFVLALIGAALGMTLGTSISALASSLHIGVVGTHLQLSFGFNWRVFAYALGAALIAGFIVGLVPALRSSGINLNDFLHDGGRSTGKRQHARNVLVIGQVAASLMLLIVAGLFARSLVKVQQTDLGFDPADVVNLSMDPKQAGYNQTQSRQFAANLLERVRALPGVESASFAAAVPLGGVNYGALLQVDGYEPAPGQQLFARKNMVSSEYFSTMRIRILSGRGILDSDTQDSQAVAVINQTMAAQFWPGENAVGKQFTEKDARHPKTLQIVGVVRNSRMTTLVSSLPVEPCFYVPLVQDQQVPITLQIRSSDPIAMAHESLHLIQTLAPILPVFEVQTMTQALDSLNGLLLFELGAATAASLGILGLLLAVAGVYGVVSYAASRRVHEIGIRAALGAQPNQILRLILWEGFKNVGSGLITGTFVSLATARLVGKFLVGVSAVDPLTYFAVSALLALVALVACWVPARRAMRIDPMVALRHE
jgi:predicted permease